MTLAHPTIGLEADLRRGLAALEIAVDPIQVQQLLAYLQLLQRWNKAYNLTAVREITAMVGVHLLDSLAILPYLGQPTRLADLGSGAGLPGIPLAIMLPQTQVLLVDSNQKKTTFLRQVAAELSLGNISVASSRVEELPSQPSFEVIVSRAFTALPQMVRWAAALLQPGVKLLAMKGQYPEDELSQLPAGYKMTACYQLQVPQLQGARHLLQIEAEAR